MRKAFSMLTAIFVIIIMATLAAYILNISGKAVGATVFQYKKEQAILYAKSYTELAIMAATSNNSTAGSTCAENINGRIGNSALTGDGFDIQTQVFYIGNNLQCANNTRILNDQSILVGGSAVIDPLHIIIDVYVKYRDPAFITAAGSSTNAPWVTYHRRTLQKL